MILLIQNIEDYNNDLRVSLQAFYGGERIVVPEIFDKKPELKAEIDKELVADIDDNRINIELYSVADGGERTLACSTQIPVDGDCRDKSAVRNPLKLAIYNMLSEYTDRRLPWGSLTGIRPTKIAVSYMEAGMTSEDIIGNYQEIYGTSREKAELAVAVADREKKIIDSVAEEDEYCLYIGIPFCPTRCLYCSFTSYPIAVYKNKVDAYLDAVEKEMAYVAEAYSGKRLISIYVGGGTPSSISAEHMDRLCSMIEKSFDLSQVREFTIEAGRPDSTTFDKLEVMKRHGVTRISINPQTMNEETLRTIGRAHTPEHTVIAMENARRAGFDNINMDLIVGLPGEDTDSVENTLRQVKELSPESLTVHTLAIKRAANLNIEMDKYRDTLKSDIDSQLGAVTRAAAEMGLDPYYLYRQKNMTGNLENVGYSKPGLECLYNQLSETVILPIAGMVLTFVATYELIQMLLEKNNMHEVDVANLYKWMFKTACAILILSNTFNIVMAVFDVSQSVIAQAGGLIQGSTDVSADMLAELETSLEAMDLGPLLGLWLQSALIGFTMKAMGIIIFVLVYGRMLEIYLLTSLAPIPVATLSNRELGSTGQNYIKSLFAVGFQGLLILVCVAIYAVLIQGIATSGDPIGAIWGTVGYTVLLCFMLFKTGSIAQRIFGAH